MTFDRRQPSSSGARIGGVHTRNRAKGWEPICNLDKGLLHDTATCRGNKAARDKRVYANTTFPVGEFPALQRPLLIGVGLGGRLRGPPPAEAAHARK